jgi:hypothetical protein
VHLGFSIKTKISLNKLLSEGEYFVLDVTVGLLNSVHYNIQIRNDQENTVKPALKTTSVQQITVYKGQSHFPH